MVLSPTEISDFSDAAKRGREKRRTTSWGLFRLLGVCASRSSVALQQPRGLSRLFLGVILLGIWRTDITFWVIPSSGEGEQVCKLCFVVAY